MAVRFDASGDALSRTTTLPTTTAYTLMAWFYRVGTGDGGHEALFGFGNATSEYALYVRHAGIATLAVTDWVSDYAGSTITDATWYHGAMTCSGTGAGQLLGYKNGVLDCTGNGGAITGSTLRICAGPAGPNEWMNGRIAAVKIYSAALTADEIKNEMRQYLPSRTANLNCWSPMLLSTDVKDYSGAGLTWTVGGTLTTEDGPPIPWSVMPIRRRRAAVVAGAGITRQMLQHAGG